MTIAALSTAGGVASGAEDPSWKDDWASAEGLALERVAIGLEFPTAVVVADTPLGPRYVVTELGGTIKTIDEAGQVEIFAVVSESNPGEGGHLSETGLAGLCLDPNNRYLFVTYGGRDEGGVLRNSIHRYELGANGVAEPPLADKDISGELHAFRSAQSHQIGGCEAGEEELFVSVGDGWDVAAARNPDILLGKVLRIDFEGDPAPDNPLANSTEGNRSYVWAYGLRNPFGMARIGTDIYVTHNGHNLDALVKIEPGVDYQWAGSDETISINALNVWVPTVGPTDLVYADQSISSLTPEWVDGFYVGTSTDANNGLQFVPFDPITSRVIGERTWAVQHIDGSGPPGPGDREQLVAAVAVDSEGVVFAGLFPGSDGETGLFRLTVDPDNQLPNRIGASSDNNVGQLDDFGCLACHQFEGVGGNIGPALDQVQLEERLETVIYSAEYEQSLMDLDLLTEKPWVDFKEARAEVLNATGKDRLPVWVKYRIMEPRFDRIEAQMPTLGITEQDAAALADVLVADQLPWWRRQALSIFGSRESANWFFLGVALTAAMAVGLALIVVLWRRWRTNRRDPTPTTDGKIT
ncbi:MAG: PQQ-dependent sugar dehydrogenase [Acidimicrobiia bacterium]